MEFKIKNGRWVIGNLYDALTASNFDVFVNSRREPEKIPIKTKLSKNHNYKFLNKLQ